MGELFFPDFLPSLPRAHLVQPCLPQKVSNKDLGLVESYPRHLVKFHHPFVEAWCFAQKGLAVQILADNRGKNQLIGTKYSFTTNHYN